MDSSHLLQNFGVSGLHPLQYFNSSREDFVGVLISTSLLKPWKKHFPAQ
jgi:hypothetical protein